MTAEALHSSSTWNEISSLLQTNGHYPKENGRIRETFLALRGIKAIVLLEETIPTPDGAYPVKFKLIIGRNPSRSRVLVDFGMTNETQSKVTITLFPNGRHKWNGDISNLGDKPHRLFNMVIDRVLASQ